VRHITDDPGVSELAKHACFALEALHVAAIPQQLDGGGLAGESVTRA
jgi:hypothetical protein